MKRTLIPILSVLWLSLSVCASTSDSVVAVSDTMPLLRELRVQEVEVVARALEKDIILPQTLRGDQLRQLSTLSVADALRYFSGVQLKDYGGVGGIKTINVRSMGSQHVGVYYNGIQLGNAQNGQVDLGRFSLDNVEEVQLYNGQKSDILQSAREFGSAGSVYLTTRRPRFRDGEKVHARVQMRAGSFDFANPSVGADVRLNDKTALTMDAEYVYSSGRYPFRYRRVTPSGDVAYDTTAVRENGDINAVRAEAMLHHYYSTTGLLRLQGYNYWSERGVPGAIVNNVWRNGERLTDRNSFVQAQWQDEFFDRWSLRFHAKYANDYTRYINRDERLLPADNRYVQQEVYASLSQRVMLTRWWDVAAAYDMQYNSLARVENGGEEEHFRRWSHWLSAATAMNLYEYVRLQASVLMTAVTAADSSRAAVRVTPGVFLTVRPWKQQDLRLNIFYKQSYRFPTFNDLYYTDMGNASLRPELARQRNIGVSYSTPLRIAGQAGSTLSVRADYYYNRVTDKIVAYPKGQQFRWTMLNLGDVRIHGVDARFDMSLALPLRFRLDGRLQYTRQRAVDVTNPADSYYGHQIPYIPWHSGSAVAGLTYTSRRGDRYALNYSFIYVGERYSQQENIAYNHVLPWYTHDLALTGDWNVQPVHLKGTLEINNLLGQDYEVIRNYPMPKQNIRCTVAVIY